ncbi:MAG: hypothetical protein ACREK8_02685 [Gemmatimonadales bacterium]
MIRGLVVVAACAGMAGRAAAQSGFGITPMAQGIFVVDRSDPVPGGGSLTEARLVQPVLMAMGHGFGGKLALTLTLDLEAATIKNGELTPGAWGEGFVDRRHPHTTFHEIVLAVNDVLGRLDGPGRLALVLGKGFVTFGSDDPMSRPFERFPVNHHLSQILERAIAIAQYDIGAVTVEGSLFDGDEPTSPSAWPLIRTDQHTWRFGDSWSGRATVRPLAGLEVQGSLAHVHSPENRPGGGPDDDKVSVSARWDDVRPAGERYALLEYARTSELEGTFIYHTVLGEGMLSRHRWQVSYRFESTERPEELRLVDPFRTQRPSPENSLVGISRWTLNTLHVAYDVVSRSHKFQAQPFIEGTLGHVARVGAGIFDPVSLYGTDQVRALNVGVLIGWGMRGHRMGRYGALATGTSGMAGMRM